jgi:hypothetical protein
MGLSTGVPAVVRSGGRFYAVIPSGPKVDRFTASGSVVYGQRSPFDGHSDQKARLIVIDVAAGREIAPGPDYLTVDEDASFFNDSFTPVADRGDRNGDWNDRTVYFGLTVSRTAASCLDGGAVYRLKLVDSKGDPLPPESWTLARLADVGRPVTGAVNAAYDDQGALWVVFATGRLWGLLDASPCAQVNDAPECASNHEQYLFGIKEDLDKDGRLTFKDLTSELSGLVDVTGAKVWDDGSVTDLKSHPALAAVLRPGGAVGYKSLSRVMRTPGVPGYKRALNMGAVLDPKGAHRYELNHAQPKITGLGQGESLLAFTTFEPNPKPSFCGKLGEGYMYALDAFTGLPSPRLASTFAGTLPTDSTSTVGPRLVTGGIHTASDKNSEAGFFRGEGKLVIRASAADNSVHSLDVPITSGSSDGVVFWREALDSGFSLSKDAMSLDAEKAD